jgi:Rab-like protein 2
MHPSYYFGAAVAVLVFDITRKVTYENLKKWYTEMRKYCEKIPCLLVGNKIDIKPEVTNKKFAFATKHS